ncbi:MAG TPA: TolC family protein [Candidatus Marinimicrobia bacterium]|nr:TolC family protein [Candidatus Neomarinimicrobiota bacterium]
MKRVIFILLIGQILAYGADSLSLKDCINLAISQNQDLKISNKQLQMAEEGIRSTYSAVLPSVSFDYSATKSTVGAGERFYQGVYIPTKDTSSNYFSTGLSLNQNLYNGGKRRNQIKLAKGEAESSRLNLNRTQQAIIANVTEKFYTVLKAKELLKVYEMTLKNSQEQLKKTEEMYKIGQVAKKDILKAQVSEGESRLNLIKQQTSLKNALNDLKMAIGLASDYALDVYEDSYLKPEIIDQAVAEQKALENNPELKSLQIQKTNSYLNYKIAQGDLWPSVNGSFSYGRDGSEIERTYSEFDKWWRTSLNLNISYPLFTGFNRKANIQQKKINYNLYDDQIEKKKLEIISEVERLILTINTNLEMIAINEINILSAQEDLRLAQEMYRLNSATLLDVLDAQVAFTKAQGNLVTTKYDAKIAEVQLVYLMGILQQPE